MKLTLEFTLVTGESFTPTTTAEGESLPLLDVAGGSAPFAQGVWSFFLSFLKRTDVAGGVGGDADDGAWLLWTRWRSDVLSVAALHL